MRKLILSLAAWLLWTGVAGAQLSTMGVGTANSGTVPLPTGMKTPVMIDNTQSAPSTSAVQFISVAGGGWSAGAINRDQPCPKAGSFKNLTVRFPTVLTQGTYTLALAINGTVAATPLQCQITTSTTTCTDTTNEIICAAGDRVSIRDTPSGTPTAQTQVQISMLFTSYTSDGMIFVPHVSAPPNGTTNYTTLGNYASTTAWLATEAAVSGILPTPGVIDSVYVQSGVAAGAGASFTYTIYLNGVSQGTSACVISGASALNCAVTGLSIAGVAGDLISVEEIPSGTPSASFTPRISVGWVPTTVGEAVQITAAAAVSGGGNTRYFPQIGSSAGNATENNVLVMAPSIFTAKFLRVATAPAVTAGTRTHIMRKGTGGGQSNQLLLCALAASATTCSDLVAGDGVTTAVNDLLNWASTTTATAPATTSYKFSSVMYTP